MIKSLFLTGAGEGFFLSSPPYPNWLLDPSSFLSNGYGDLSPAVEWPGCEVHHSPPSNTEAKNAWNYYLHSPNTSS